MRRLTERAVLRSIPHVNVGEESFLWWCRSLKLPVPMRNFLFHPVRRFEIDWAWPQWKIGVEIQGGVYMAGRGAHSRPENIIRDMVKHNLLLDLGWRVWLFTPQEAKSGAAIQHLDAMLRSLQSSRVAPGSEASGLG